MAYLINDECIGCQACQIVCPVDAITGEKKELHSIGEQTCIDCGACGRICPAEAVLDNFGILTVRIKKKQWPKPVIDIDSCMSCHICSDACPSSALDMELIDPENHRTYPVLADDSRCMGCGFCEIECPVMAITMKDRKYSDLDEEAA